VAVSGPGRTGDPVLERIRLGLASELFDAAGRARRLAREHEVEQAMAELASGVWRQAWERAVPAAAERLVDVLGRRFTAAGRESRMPAPMLKRCLPSESERLAIAAHLGKGTRRLEDALEELDGAVARVAASRREPEGLAAWGKAVELCARRVEAAWLDLEDAVLRERDRWAAEIEAVRRWRRPKWPMMILSFAVAAAAVYLGLVFGGFIDPPEWLRPLAEYWWERL